MASDFSRETAVRLDESDPLSAFRNRFELPLRADGSPQAYFAGNSLGALPRTARDAVGSVIENWSELAAAMAAAASAGSTAMTSRIEDSLAAPSCVASMAA